MRPLTAHVLAAAGALIFAAGAAMLAGCHERREADVMTSPKDTRRSSGGVDPVEGAEGYEKATFAAGCFWGVEATFRRVGGVAATCVGYTGGHTKEPTYQQVCTDRTGHAEALRVIYDPAEVTYEDLLDVFWRCHDPTTLNRQGPDAGSQYRSAIFYHTPQQEAAARASKARLQQSGKHRRPVVTEIAPASTFWRAEEYHQRYLEKRGQASCHLPEAP
jgi:peptide-methionine (S)-S-oxide reductase